MKQIRRCLGVVLGCAALVSGAVACEPPEAAEATRSTTSKLLVPPLLEFDASEETRESAGVDNWGLYLGQGAVYLTGYRQGRPVQGASTGFRTASDRQTRELVAELSSKSIGRFASARSLATDATQATGPLSDGSAAFRTAALRDVALARRALRSSQGASSTAALTVPSSASCSQDLLTLFMNALASGTGAANGTDLARRAAALIGQANARCAGIGTPARASIPRSGGSTSASGGTRSGSSSTSSGGSARSGTSSSGGGTTTVAKKQPLDLDQFCKTRPQDCSSAKAEESCLLGNTCSGTSSGTRSTDGMISYACDDNASGLCWAPRGGDVNNKAFGSETGSEVLGKDAAPLLQDRSGGVDYRSPEILQVSNESNESWQCGDCGAGVINASDVRSDETSSSSSSSGGSGELEI